MADKRIAIIPEDLIDDILYFARAGETNDLVLTLKSIAADASTPFKTEAEVLGVAKDEYSGNNAVHMAAGNGHFGRAPPCPRLQAIDTIKEILSLIPKPINSTAPPHAIIAHKNASGNTPLHWAALNGHVKIVEVLVLTANADPTVKNDAGHDPVYEAELNEKMDVVEWILGNCESIQEGVGGREGSEEQDEKINGEKTMQEGIERLNIYKGDSRNSSTTRSSRG